MLNYIIQRIDDLKPLKPKMILEGFSEKEIERIYLEEFTIQQINNIKVNSLLEDFIRNYNIKKFRVRNLFFNEIIEKEIIEGHLIFGYIENGYISIHEDSGKFYTSFAEDVGNTLSFICENEIDFFNILLVIIRYSKDSYEGLTNENSLEHYIEKCEEISPNGEFYPLFV